MINRFPLKSNQLTDKLIWEFKKMYNTPLYFNFTEKRIIEYKLEDFWEPHENDYGFGEFSGHPQGTNDSVDSIFISDSDLIKITDEKGMNILWERSPEDPISHDPRLCFFPQSPKGKKFLGIF